MARRLGVTLSPNAPGSLLEQIPPIARRLLVDALLARASITPGAALDDVERVLRRLPPEEFQAVLGSPYSRTFGSSTAATDTPATSGPRVSVTSPSGLLDSSDLARHGYPLGPEFHVPLPASPSWGDELVFEAHKPGGATPGAMFREPYSGRQVLVKAADPLQNPEAEAFVDRLTRALFTGLVPTQESEVVRGRTADELIELVPFPGLCVATEMGAAEGGLYVRPFLPLWEVEMSHGGTDYGFPHAASEAEIADALRAARVDRTVGNVDLHAENIAAWRAGRAGTIDAGLALIGWRTDPLFDVKPYRPAGQLLRQIITGENPIAPVRRNQAGRR